MATKNTEENKVRAQVNDHTGFSAGVLSHNQRLLKPDGTFNIDVRGLPWFRPSDAFEHLIKMSWPRFIFYVMTTYVAVNTVFAFIYFLIGVENLTNSTGETHWLKFLDAFFFSSQSLTTVGYGRVAPVGIAASTVAALESMLGLLGFALATGLLYGRFSRPNAKLLHSKNILISPYKDGKALVFRIANKRESQLVEVEVRVTMKRNAIENGKEVRQFIPLLIENPRQNMFPLSWAIIHYINESSPLWGKSIDDLVADDVEFLIYFKGFDETFSNNVHYRISYKPDELVWGAQFILNFEEEPGRPTVHYLNKLNDYETVELPKAAS